MGIGRGVGAAVAGGGEVFDELGGDLFEEARGHGGLGAVVAVAAAIAGAGHDEGVHGAGHADVAEAALLFHLRGVLEGAGVGEETFFHAGEEDERELEAFGGVEGHEGDAGFGGVAVGVGDEGGVVEKLGEGFAAGGGVLRGVG